MCVRWAVTGGPWCIRCCSNGLCWKWFGWHTERGLACERVLSSVLMTQTWCVIVPAVSVFMRAWAEERDGEHVHLTPTTQWFTETSVLKLILISTYMFWNTNPRRVVLYVVIYLLKLRMATTKWPRWECVVTGCLCFPMSGVIVERDNNTSDVEERRLSFLLFSNTHVTVNFTVNPLLCYTQWNNVNIWLRGSNLWRNRSTWLHHIYLFICICWEPKQKK